MFLHFEELWEKCENLHKETSKETSTQSIMDELMMKINLYNVIDKKPEISDEDKKIIKSRTMGEILLTLTSLSLKDNIDVFDSLNKAFQYYKN